MSTPRQGGYSVYEDIRTRSVDARADALPGAVFGFESEEEDRSIFMQEYWPFQSRDPVVVSRYTPQLPPGWRAESITRNQDELKPNLSGSVYSWDLRDLPPIESQEASPRISSLAPYLAISYFAGGGRGDSPEFTDWRHVSEWLTRLIDERAAADEAIRTKVGELTKNAATPLEKIQAIGAFVQSVRYASIQIGLARGGGYQPHPAIDVFAKNYGDCKGKATLMKTMLREAGIESHTVSIYTGDPRRVYPEWPSPHQFNHAIVAVKVPPDVDSPAVAEVSGLGRLLFFDPTDDDTPLGILPEHEQDSFVLVEAGSLGALVKTPKAKPETNHIHREVAAELTNSGGLEASITEHAQGGPATRLRRTHKALTAPDYRKHLDSWLSGRVPGSRINQLEVEAALPEFERQLALSAESYGQRMGGKLWVFRTSILDRQDDYDLKDEKRIHDFILGAESFSERATFRLPENYAADEIPDPIAMESPYGRYRASWKVDGGEMTFKQALTVESSVVAAAEYNDMRDFLLRVRGASGASVVLAVK